MDATSYTNFRKHLKSYMDSVFENKTPLYVTRSNGEDVVVLAKDDYESLQETLFLTRNTKNAARLREGIEQYEQGKLVEKTIDDLEQCE